MSQTEGNRFEVVKGTPIAFTMAEVADHDDTFGVPGRVAQEVSRQILGLLVERDLQPDGLLFSDYANANDLEHAEKAIGDFAGDDGAHEYFFTGFDALEDGEEGPLAYAATCETPAIGVYNREQLIALGYDELGGTVITTPAELLGALVFEFRPTYDIPECY